MFEMECDKNGKVIKWKSLDGKRINWEKEFFALYKKYDYIVQRNMELADRVNALEHEKDMLLDRLNYYI